MISQRLRGVKEDGEAIEEAGFMPKLKEMFSGVGIDIEDSNGELRSTYEILNDLAAVWDQLSSKQQQYFGEKVAGNRQVKTLNAIMQNWNVVSDTIEDAENAEGEALKGNEMYMDSIEGRITQLKSAMQELAKETISSDFVKGIVSAGTSVVKLISDLGGLAPVLTTILGVILAIKGADIATGLAKIGHAITELFSGASLVAGLPGILLAVASVIAMVVTHLNNANSAIKKFEEAKESYEEHRSKVESLNGELKTTRERIKELEGKEPLTIVEEKELERLREVNTELQKQIAFEQTLADIAKGEQKKAAVKSFEEEAATQYTGGFFGKDVQYSKAVEKTLGMDWLKANTKGSTTILDGLNEVEILMPTKYEQVAANLAALAQQLQNLKSVNDQLKETDPTDEMYGELDSKKKEIQDYIQTTQKELYDFYNKLSEYTDGFEYVEGAEEGSVDAKMNTMIELQNQMRDVMTEAGDVGMQSLPIDQLVDKILSRYSDAVDEIKAKIKETGDFTVDDLGKPQFEAMIQEFEKYGINASEVAEIIKEKFGGVGDVMGEIGSQMAVSVEDVNKKLYQNDEGYDVLSKALSEQDKSGTLSADTLNKVLNESKLNGVADALERTATGYRLNTDRVNELINAQNEEGRIDALAGIMERQIALEELAEKYGSLEEAMKDADAAEQIAQYQSEIAVLQALADEAEAAASALDKLRAAQKSPNQGADYSDAQSALEKTKEAYKEGKVGTDDFKAGMDYLLGDGWLERAEGDVDKALKSFEEKRKQYFSGDDFNDATNFAKDLVDKGMLGYDDETGKLTLLQNEATGATYTLEEMAAALGISKDAAQDLFELLNEYSLEDQFNFDTPIDSADKLAAAEKKLAELEEKRAQLEKEIAEAKEPGGDTSGLAEMEEELANVNEEAAKLSSAIETAQEAMANGEFEPPQTLEDALAKLQEYQNAIDALNAEGITTIVELQGDFDTLLDFVNGGDGKGTYNIAVNDTGDAQAKLADINTKIAAVEKARDEGNLSVELAAKITGNYEDQKDALTNYISQAEELKSAVPGGSLSATITFNAETGEWEITFDEVEADKQEIESDPVQIGFTESESQSGSSVKEKVQGALTGIEAIVAVKEGTENTGSTTKGKIQGEVQGIEAPVDAVEGDKTGADVKSTIEGAVSGIQALIAAKATNVAEAKGKLDDIAKERTAEIKVKVTPITPEDVEKEIGDYGVGGTSGGADFDYWQLTQQLDLSVNEDDVAGQVQDAVESGAENAEANVTPEMSEEDWDQFYEEFDEAAGHPFDVDPNVDTGEVADQVEEGIENGASNADPEVDVGVDGDDIEDEIEDNMPDSEEFDAEANTDGIEGQVRDAVPEEVPVKVTAEPAPAPTSMPDQKVQGTMSLDTSSASSSIDEVQSKASETQTMGVDADTSEADSKIDDTQEDASTEQTMPVSVDVHRGALDSLLNDLKKDREVKVKVVYEEVNKPAQLAVGTDNAKGGISLVDEEGAELIEHRKSGTFELGTNNGARFTHLDKGDVVHTADETKKIMSRLGYFGGFFRDGLNKAKSIIGNAFATGVSGGGTMPKKRGDNSSGSGSGSKKKGSSSKDKEKDEKNEWSEWAKQFFDWAEIKLKNLKEATEDLIRQSQRAIGVWEKNKKIKEALNAVEKEIKANEEAYKKYMNTANEVAKKAGFSEEMIKRIQEGTLDISRYDDATQEKIKEYQKWYDKAKECKKAIEDLIDKEKELAKQRLQNIVDDYDYRAKHYQNQEDIEEAKRDYDETRGKAVKGTKVKKVRTGSGETEYQFGEGYGDYDKQIEALENRQKELVNERQSLSEELKSLMQQGLVKEGDDTWKEYMSKLEQLEKDAYQAAAAIERLKEEARKAGITPIQDKIDRLEGAAAKRDRERSLGETQGSFGSRSKKQYYKDQIKNAKAQNKNLEYENQLYRQLQEGLDKSSQKYKDLQALIDKNQQTIDENNQSVAEWEKALQNLPIEKLEDKMNGLTTASDKLNDSIKLKLAKGIEVTADSYKDLIKNGKAQISNLKKQRNLYQKLMDEMVAMYGEEAKSSDAYKALQAQVDGIDASIRDLDLSIVQLKKDMQNLAIEKIGWQIEGLKAKADELADALSLKRAKGIEITEQDYREQINTAKEEQKRLEKQNKKLRKRQKGMDEDSPEYQALQRQIEANEDTIRSLDESIVQLKKDIKNIPVLKLQWDLSSIQAAADSLSHAINMKILTGQAVTAGDYQAQISNANAQIDVLRQINDELRVQQSGMDLYSDAWQDLQKQIQENERTIRSLDESMAQWGKDIQNIPVESVRFSLDTSKYESSMAEKQMKLRESSGQPASAADYQSVINSNNGQINATNNLISSLRSLQWGMDSDSEEYRKLQKEIYSLNLSIIDLKLSNIELAKRARDIAATEFGYYADRYDVSKKEKEDAIELKKVIGRQLDFYRDYSGIITDMQNQNYYLERQIKEWENNQNGLQFNSSDYQAYQSQIDNARQKIRDNQIEIAKLGKKSFELWYQEQEWQLDELENQADRISALMDLNTAQGREESVSAYRDLIRNGLKRIEILEKENYYLDLQLSTMDKMSEAYQDIEKQIADNNATINDIKISQEEWNDSIVDIGISNLEKYKNALTKINDQLQQQKNLQNAIQELEKAETQRKVRTYVEGQGFVYQSNEDDIKKAQENLEDIIKDQLLDKIDDLIDALEDAKADTNVYDENGTLIGYQYNTPELDNLADLLSKYYSKNSTTAIDLDVLKQALGKNIVPTQPNKTAFTIGDIVINEVKDGNKLAETIINQFPNALLQALYGK